MKFYVICCLWTILPLQTVFSGFTENQNPLVMLYYPQEEVYALSDATTIENLPYAATYSKIILFCPLDNEISDEKLFEIQTILSSAAIINVACHVPVKPSIHHLKDPVDKTRYAIEYYIPIHGNNREKLREHKLGDTFFQIMDSYGSKYISRFWVIEVNFNIDLLVATKTYHRFSAYVPIRQPLPSCTDYSWGIESLQGDEVLKYYDVAYQNTIDLLTEYKEQSNDSLVSHQLTPINDFVDVNSRMATCTYFNIVPIWKSISQQRLEFIERYIQMVAEELQENTLGVTTMTYDVLTLPPNPEKNTPPQPIYLDPTNKKIPVPKVILKLITYRVPFPVPKDVAKRRALVSNDDYGITIVIPNELKHVTKICGHNAPRMCENLGWFVTAFGVYCCDFNNASFPNIDVNVDKRFNFFNLNNVPVELDWKTKRFVDVVKKLREKKYLPAE